MLAAVRDARQEEAGAIADLLSRAAFGPTVSRLVAFPRTSPHGDVLVAENGEGAAAAWRGTAGAIPTGVDVRRLREDDRAAVSELDRGATGEDRSNLLDALHPLAGVAADRSGTLAGWAAKAPYGAGIAICAGDD